MYMVEKICSVSLHYKRKQIPYKKNCTKPRSIKSYKNLYAKDIRIKGNIEILYIYEYVIQLLLLYYLSLYPAIV